MEDLNLLREHADRIVRSGALGRSRSYARLLEFLVACSSEGRTPKELEIAMEVFGKGPDFDPSQDSMVRVYAHNLRQKLDQFYAAEGRADSGRLSLARGEYRVSIVAPDVAPAAAEPPSPRPSRRRPSPLATRRRGKWLPLAAAALLAVGGIVGWAVGANRHDAPSAAASIAHSPLWVAAVRRRPADPRDRRGLLHFRRARRARRHRPPGSRFLRQLEQGPRRAHDVRAGSARPGTWTST